MIIITYQNNYVFMMTVDQRLIVRFSFLKFCFHKRTKVWTTTHSYSGKDQKVIETQDSASSTRDSVVSFVARAADLV